ncbi:MAG: Fe-S cluster assembly sulfur transfer protein SufU [Candidatus Zixiibacteriota bacterium]
MSDKLDDLYREIILDHFRSPRGGQPVNNADISSEGHNPACGDEIKLNLAMDNGTVKDIHVNCQGCAISIASGSMLAEYIKGKSIEDVIKLSEIVKKILKGEEAEIPEDFDDLDALKGVRNFPVRIKCALLAWMTLIEGLKNYENGKRNPETIVTTED